MVAAHRIIGIGEVDQPGLSGFGGGKQGFGVFMIAKIGHAGQRAAKAGDVKIEGWIGAGRGDDRDAGVQRQAGEIAEKAVDPLTDDNMGGGEAVMARDSGFEIVIFGIAVHPDIGRGAAHGGDGMGRGAEEAFIRAEAGGKGPGTGALLGLGADEGHGGRQGGGERGQELGHVGKVPAGWGLCKGRAGGIWGRW